MTEVHSSDAELEQYAIGALDDAAARALETHAELCPDCAERLAREARLELALFEVASRSGAVTRRRPRMWVSVAGASLAAAAVWLMMVRGAPPASGAPAVVRCDERGSAARCIRQAGFDGLLSVGPGDSVEVPRYDESPAGQTRSSP